MDDNRNADALEVLDAAIKRVERSFSDAVATRRDELIAKYGNGNALAGTGIKQIGKMLNGLLDDALSEIPGEAIKYAADREAALPEFKTRLLALVEDAQRHLDAYARFVMKGSLSPQSKQAVTQLLDESRGAVRASIIQLRGGPAPVSVGDPAPFNAAHRLSSQERDDECRRVAQLLDADGVTIRNVTAAKIAAHWDPSKGSPLAIGSITMFMSGGAKGRPQKRRPE